MLIATDLVERTNKRLHLFPQSCADNDQIVTLCVLSQAQVTVLRENPHRLRLFCGLLTVQR